MSLKQSRTVLLHASQMVPVPENRLRPCCGKGRIRNAIRGANLGIIACVKGPLSAIRQDSFDTMATEQPSSPTKGWSWGDCRILILNGSYARLKARMCQRVSGGASAARSPSLQRATICSSVAPFTSQPPPRPKRTDSACSQDRGDYANGTTIPSYRSLTPSETSIKIQVVEICEIWLAARRSSRPFPDFPFGSFQR